jgi:hypothetical protein
VRAQGEAVIWKWEVTCVSMYHDVGSRLVFWLFSDENYLYVLSPYGCLNCLARRDASSYAALHVMSRHVTYRGQLSFANFFQARPPTPSSSSLKTQGTKGYTV